MNIVIAGGGKIGYYLVKTLIPFRHRLIVIEKDKIGCERLTNDLGVIAIHGDSTTLNVLEEAEIKKADVFIAVTGNDEDNLIACQLAKGYFHVKKTMARVRNPQNIMVFEKLGVDNAISSTSIIADLIEQEVDFNGIKTLLKLKSGKVILDEILIPPTSPIKDTAIKDMAIPKQCVLISIIRGEEVIIPNGFTVLKAGDVVIAVHTKEESKALKEYFIG